MEFDCVVVWTTIGATADGQGLASVLVGERLAACVNILGEMDSVYRWEGRIETARERQLLIKTTARRLPAVEARLRELHGYEIPEFIVLPVAGGSDAYLQWIREATAE